MFINRKVYFRSNDRIFSSTNSSQVVVYDSGEMQRQPLPKFQVDAGSCWQDVTKPLQDYQKDSLTFPVGHCLPTFLVVGVQKGGTDELAVWLNFNVYQRRLDGGVELHFFDCVGRYHFFFSTTIVIDSCILGRMAETGQCVQDTEILQ